MKNFKIVKDSKNQDSMIGISIAMACANFKEAIEKNMHYTYKIGDMLPLDYFTSAEEAIEHIKAYGNPRDTYKVYELEYDQEKILKKFTESKVNCVTLATQIMNDTDLLKFKEIDEIKLVETQDSFEEIKKIAEDHTNKPLKKKAVEFDPKKLVRTKYVDSTHDGDDKGAEIKAALLVGKGTPYIISTVANSYNADQADAFIDLDTAKEFVDKQDYKLYVNKLDVVDGKVVVETVYENKAETVDEAIAYYVYLDHPYGRELIGKVFSEEEAKKIKADKDSEWKTGDMWHTFITNKELEEMSMYDSFEEIDKNMKKPNGKPLKKTEVKIDPEEVQRQKALVEDSRDFIGEEDEHYYDYYRRFIIYKNEDGTYETEVFEKKLTSKSFDELKTMIDKEIVDRIEDRIPELTK